MAAELVSPDARYWASWHSAMAESKAADRRVATLIRLAEQAGLDLGDRADFATWVGMLNAQTMAIGDAKAVPATNWWIVDGDEYLGAIQLRHRLNEFLAEVGGHIGYGVRPTARGRGFATSALRQVLCYAASDIKLNEVLLTCDEYNIGSRTVIERCGGVLTGTRAPDDKSREVGHTGRTLQYWIPTSGRPE